MLRSTSFVFDGIPSENYGLMIYFLDDDDKRSIELGTNVEFVEDRLPRRTTPIHYGVNINKSMSFPLTFGSTEYLTDYDVDAILSWLTGHNQYKWLEYTDDDHYVRYRCHLNNMKTIHINGLPVAFECDVECDGQFAYEYSTQYTYDLDTVDLNIDFLNRSSYNGYIYPTVKLYPDDNCIGVSIINETDNNRLFKVGEFPRVSTSDNTQAINKYVTINQLASDNDVDADIISWAVNSTGTNGNYGDVIFGDGTLVMLPVAGNTALYSIDGGETWVQSTLPHSGSWTGCYGNHGFVAICTDENTAVATYSQDGKTWTSSPISLPITQKWNCVKYVHTQGVVAGQYIAVGNSSNIAISSTGLSWLSEDGNDSITLPTHQNWTSVFEADGKIFAVGGNSNIAAYSINCLEWFTVNLPVSAPWTDGIYNASTGTAVIIANTADGTSQDSIAVYSDDLQTWKTVKFPLGNWLNIEFINNQFVAVGNKKYTYSVDGGLTWKVNSLPAIVTNMAKSNSALYCTTDSSQYIMCDFNGTAVTKGSFEIELPTDIEIPKVEVYAQIDATNSDGSFDSKGLVLLATYEVGNDEESTQSGDVLTAISTDTRQTSMDGIMMSAVYNEETKTVKIDYVADLNSSCNAANNATITITANYQGVVSNDLGYYGLEIDIDNKNQIITTNKDNLNMYKYFNMKFLRFVKGTNRLKMSSIGGKCKMVITCDFLRKVGGR